MAWLFWLPLVSTADAGAWRGKTDGDTLTFLRDSEEVKIGSLLGAAARKLPSDLCFGRSEGTDSTLGMKASRQGHPIIPLAWGNVDSLITPPSEILNIVGCRRILCARMRQRSFFQPDSLFVLGAKLRPHLEHAVAYHEKGVPQSGHDQRFFCESSQWSTPYSLIFSRSASAPWR